MTLVRIHFVVSRFVSALYGFNHKLTSMLNQGLYFLLLILLSQLVHAQPKQSVDMVVLPPKIAKFIPEGYVLVDTAMGNLNLDKYKDVILVLKTSGEDTAEYPWELKRPLILLLGGSDETFTLAARNDNILHSYDRSNAFGDPYEDVEIKSGVFKVTQVSGGASFAAEEKITFKFSIKENTWYLFKVEEETWTRTRTRKGIEKGDDEINIYTKKDFGTISINKYQDWR